MSWRRQLAKLGALFYRRKPMDDLEDEIRSHLEKEEQENLESGMPPDEAHYAALRRFGNVTLAQERSSEMWGWNSVETLAQDARYGLRQLQRSPGFTAVAVLTLALGIGVNTAIFSAVSALLLRPLPYRNPSQLVRVGSATSYPDFKDWIDQNFCFQQIGAYSGRSYNLSGGDHPERINGLQVSVGLLAMLGIEPVLGRDFLPEEHQLGRNHVVLLGDGLWRSRFAADRAILGKALTLNDDNYTVIGILPSSFDSPSGDLRELVVPITPDPERTHGWLAVIGRLKPGVTLAQAQAEMTTIAGRGLEQQHGEDKGQGVDVQPLQASYVNDFRPVLMILLGAVGFVLLIACLNVANLFLGRAAARRRELAVRAALGAGRRRLIRQLLTESLLVGVMGGILGLLLAVMGLDDLVSLLARNFFIPRPENIRVDRWVLAFTLVVSLLAGLVSGLAPALGASKVDLNESLKKGSRGLSGSLGQTRFRSALVVSEVALALVLLSGAGLMIKSFALLAQIDSGLQAENVLTVDFSLVSAKYSHPATRADLFQQILHRVQTLPGVESTAIVADVPLTRNEDGFYISIEGFPEPLGERRHARFNVVSPDYFRTLGIRVLEGRDFAESDVGAAPGVVLINQTMAHQFWPHANPIGQRITTDKREWKVFPSNAWFSIIGIVGDTRQIDLKSETRPEVYVSYLQDPYQWPYRSMLVRTASNPLKMFPIIEQAVWSVDKDQPLSNPMTMDQVRSDSIVQPRVMALLLGLFAALALVLAAVGLYGLVARSVAERTHEIGVRMALGAQRLEVLRLIVHQGMLLALVGAVVGLAGALVATRILTNLLYNVRPTDLGTLMAVSILLIAVATLASFIPARRATKVDPMVALRYE